MFKSVCLIGAVLVMAGPALADTACGSAPIADAIPAPAAVAGKTAEEAQKIRHDAYVSVTGYQGKLKVFRECLMTQSAAQKNLITAAKDDNAKKAPQAALEEMQKAYDKAYDNETAVVQEYVALQTAVCKIADCKKK